MEEKDIKVAAIVGPTAAGKSDTALLVAERLGGEIISADSMQIYRGMDIGTGKPDLPTRQRIRHHMIDVVPPEKEFSAAEYQSQARKAIKEINERGNLPILVGGTGLYVSSCLDDLKFPSIAQDTDARQRLSEIAEREGAANLHKRLLSVDPKAAAAIHPNNVRRVIRALEVYELTGLPYSEAGGGFKNRQSIYDSLIIGLRTQPDVLKRRIEARVDKMITEGWLKEAKALFEAEPAPGMTAKMALGYRQLYDYLNGKTSWEEAVAAIKTATKRYAKRQMTWFNADSRIVWLETGERFTASKTACEVESYIKQRLHGSAS